MASKAQREAVRTRAAAVNAAIGSFRKPKPNLSLQEQIIAKMTQRAEQSAPQAEQTEPAA
jgi:hypothetical protein